MRKIKQVKNVFCDRIITDDNTYIRHSLGQWYNRMDDVKEVDELETALEEFMNPKTTFPDKKDYSELVKSQKFLRTYTKVALFGFLRSKEYEEFLEMGISLGDAILEYWAYSGEMKDKGVNYHLLNGTILTEDLYRIMCNLSVFDSSTQLPSVKTSMYDKKAIDGKPVLFGYPYTVRYKNGSYETSSCFSVLYTTLADYSSVIEVAFLDGQRKLDDIDDIEFIQKINGASLSDSEIDYVREIYTYIFSQGFLTKEILKELDDLALGFSFELRRRGYDIFADKFPDIPFVAFESLLADLLSYECYIELVQGE